MENSMSRVVSSNERTSADVSPEESGWTMYFDHFFNQDKENSCFSSGLESSLISDAASSIVKNKVAENEQVMRFSQETSSDKLTFKKRKTKLVLVDDDLEDTASSPADGPKVRKRITRYFNSKPEQMDISREKTSSSLAHMEERSTGVLGSIGRENNTRTTELKKRALSFIADNLG